MSGVSAGNGILFVVSTPIGNLGDITLRAVETLRSCDGILVEDTRRTRRLLTHLDIRGKRVDRVDAHASLQTLDGIVRRLMAGERLAIVTDAGTPSVSDPGAALIQAATQHGVQIVPIPGASALLCALVASGMGGDGPFRFLGFLPRQGAKRAEALATLSETPEVCILFEAPARLQSTLIDLGARMPHRRACVARELTKMHEELVHGTCSELAASDRSWMGEVVVVLGPHVPVDQRAGASDADIDLLIDRALDQGEGSRAIAQRLAAWSGRSRRAVYERVIARKETIRN